MKIIRALAFVGILLFSPLLFFFVIEPYLSDTTMNWLIRSHNNSNKEEYYRLAIAYEIEALGLLPLSILIGFAAGLFLPIRKATKFIYKLMPLCCYYIYLGIPAFSAVGGSDASDFVLSYQPLILALLFSFPLYFFGLWLGMPVYLKLQPIWIRVTRTKPAAPADTKENIMKEIAADPTL